MYYLEYEKLVEEILLHYGIDMSTFTPYEKLTCILLATIIVLIFMFFICWFIYKILVRI